MLYNFESNKIDYCQEDLFSIENIEKISQFSIPENSFIAEPQILPNVIKIKMLILKIFKVMIFSNLKIFRQILIFPKNRQKK